MVTGEKQVLCLLECLLEKKCFFERSWCKLRFLGVCCKYVPKHKMGEGGRAGGFDGDTTADGFPRKDGDSLFGKMMLAIRGSHSFGNKVRMLKFPLILTDTKLYGGALANFYWLTRALELRLESPEVQAHPIITHVRDLGLKVTEGYEADLKQLLGEDWQTAAARARTPRRGPARRARPSCPRSPSTAGARTSAHRVARGCRGPRP